MVDERIKEFLVTSFQSYIWNEVVARLVENTVPAENIVRLRYTYGHFLFYRNQPWNPGYLELPFPSPRIRLPEDLKSLYDKVLNNMDIPDIEHLRTTVKGWVFKSHRRTLKIVTEIDHHWEWDPEHPGKRIWTLKFSLPPGSYATMLIRRVFWKEQV